jgi:hypothetical protein
MSYMMETRSQRRLFDYLISHQETAATKQTKVPWNREENENSDLMYMRLMKIWATGEMHHPKRTIVSNRKGVEAQSARVFSSRCVRDTLELKL